VCVKGLRGTYAPWRAVVTRKQKSVEIRAPHSITTKSDRVFAQPIGANIVRNERSKTLRSTAQCARHPDPNPDASISEGLKALYTLRVTYAPQPAAKSPYIRFADGAFRVPRG
jgi:hypothetical protein